jgi:hypothetical protein
MKYIVVNRREDNVQAFFGLSKIHVRYCYKIEYFTHHGVKWRVLK